MKLTTEWKFLVGIVLIYIILFFTSNELFVNSSAFFLDIFLKMLPALLLVFIFMFIVNLFVKKDLIQKLFNHVHGWLFAIIGGILSIGPVYAWYPLLEDMKKKGVSHGMIACFIYSKAIKIPLIPVMIFYFGTKYVLIFSIVIIFFAIIQGMIMNKIMDSNYS